MFSGLLHFTRPWSEMGPTQLHLGKLGLAAGLGPPGLEEPLLGRRPEHGRQPPRAPASWRPGRPRGLWRRHAGLQRWHAGLQRRHAGLQRCLPPRRPYGGGHPSSRGLRRGLRLGPPLYEVSRKARHQWRLTWHHRTSTDDKGGRRPTVLGSAGGTWPRRCGRSGRGVRGRCCCTHCRGSLPWRRRCLGAQAAGTRLRVHGRCCKGGGDCGRGILLPDNLGTDSS